MHHLNQDLRKFPLFVLYVFALVVPLVARVVRDGAEATWRTTRLRLDFPGHFVMGLGVGGTDRS